MANLLVASWSVLLLSSITYAQQECYFGPGSEFRGPTNLVPCASTGSSACCLLGDTCLSGNACYNGATGNTYQYGCTDITYTDSTCPYKCGFDPRNSPWIGMEFCDDVPGVSDTWICEGPENCGCEWTPTYDLLILPRRGCKEMGSEALVALNAPSALAPWISLPFTIGGSTGYYSSFTSNGVATWVQTAISGYRPATPTQLTTYMDGPYSSVFINRNAAPGPATYPSARSYAGPGVATRTNSPSNQPVTATAFTPGSTTSSYWPVDTGLEPQVVVQSSETSSRAVPPSQSQTKSSTAALTAAISSSSASASTSSTDLSTGAKAGIGIGAALGICLIAGTIFAVLVMRKRRQRRQSQIPEIQTEQRQPPRNGTASWGNYDAVRPHSDSMSKTTETS